MKEETSSQDRRSTARTEKLQIYVPCTVYERLKRVAKENHTSLSDAANTMICENLDTNRVITAIRTLQTDVQTAFLGLELLGAHMDELAKLIAIRMPAQEGLTDEQKTEISYKAQRLSSVLSHTALETVRSYYTGESALDPLGIRDLFSSLETFVPGMDDEEQDSQDTEEE